MISGRTEVNEIAQIRLTLKAKFEGNPLLSWKFYKIPRKLQTVSNFIKKGIFHRYFLETFSKQLMYIELQ